MASKCQKFLPNIFNKSKCQHCFAAKEAHTAAALENNKASRKVSKCGYLFVSPGYDFSNPLDRTRRWQRRFFRLYDDGEFSYCVDENPDTVPQGIVDMNKCTDVLDAEAITTHPFSLSIVTPEKTVYIKGNSKEEVQWWQEILGEFPKALKAILPRRKQPVLILSNKENSVDTIDGLLEEAKLGRYDFKSRADASSYATFRGVRSLKHKYDSSYQEGLRKSSSLHDLSSEDQEMRETLESSRYLSRSGDRLDSLSRDNTFSLSRNSPPSIHSSPPFTVPRSTWTRTGQPIPSAFLNSKNGPSSYSSISSASSTASGSLPRLGSLEDRALASVSKNVGGKPHRERSASLKDFTPHLSVARDSGDSLTQTSLSADELESNETDELKMARSSEVISRPLGKVPSTAAKSPAVKRVSDKLEDLVYMKKGWLIKQAPTEKESRKHWFVLAGNSLRYYEDAKAEESNLLEGRIDLSSCYEVSEMPTHRNYGFKIKTRNGEYILAAMTSGIRNNWMKAIRLCMELHSSVPKWKFSTPQTGASVSAKSPPRTAVDDLEFKSGAASSLTAAVTGAGGETAFQLVGRRDPYKRETQKPPRRHHSDVNPGNVSKVLSVKEFTASLEPAGDSVISSSGSTRSTDSSVASSGNRSRMDLNPSASKVPRHRSPSTENLGRSTRTGGTKEGTQIKRFVEGSDNLPAANSGAAAQGPEQLKQTPKRTIASESNKEEVKRELMRRAKSPSARVKEKSRGAKTPRLHSPITAVDETYNYQMGSATASDAGSAMSDTADEPAYNDIPMSEEDYPAQEDTDHDEVGSATASDVVGGEDALVEILETEVETLKDRLELTQTELDKMHKDNMDLKSRLHKESVQSLDSGYSSRWGPSSNQSDAANSRWSQAANGSSAETLKRQLKESKDTVQRQRMEVEALKSKLDMSVSKLTGTEKALSEALKDYKQEKDKFVKLSSEWNRRIRTLEGQSKDNIHKLERSRESLQTKERECRRLEAELKTNLQKTREQEREILKLKAVEHEYNQLKEKLDDREHELANLRSELKEKEHLSKKMKDEYEQQLDQLDREYGQERDDLENHMEQLKSELYSAHDRQASLTDNMTSNIADILKEKDDTIAQLEEKMIEADKKLIDLSDELHAEMGENADLAHTIDMLQKDKLKLTATIEELEVQLMSLKTKVSAFESDNVSLRRQLEELRHENTQLHEGLTNAHDDKDHGDMAMSQGDKERENLKKTVVELNKRIQDLQAKLEPAESMTDRKYDRGNSASSISSIASDHQQDLLHNILVVDSQLKEVNAMLHQLRQNFDTYIEALPEQNRKNAIKLADLIEDVGHKCQDVQDILRDGSPQTVQESDYKHVITVSALSSGKAVFEEYKGLKGKFDQAVAELKKVKKDLKDSLVSYDSLKQEDTKLKEKMAALEGAYKKQIVELIARVDGLNSKIVNVQPNSKVNQPPVTSAPGGEVVKEIEQQLAELGERITSLEQQSAHVTKPAGASCNPVARSSEFLVKLGDIRAQLESTNLKLKQLTAAFPAAVTNSPLLLSRMESYEKRLGSLKNSLQLSQQASVPKVDNTAARPSDAETSAASAGVISCLHEIRERVREIGEQLDSLEEGDDDSDSEDEGEQTTVEDIRERLAQLTEYIEQHSKLSTSDWTLLRLMSLQKESLKAEQDPKDSMEVDGENIELKLKTYSDRLSLEAVLLSEMAHILQTKDSLSSDDCVCREIDSLNSHIISLHQRLDNEMKTMHFEESQSDVVASYVELMAEKVLINGQLCSSLFDQKSHLGKDSDSLIQPSLLATEALLRSQIDSYISTNLDKTTDEILSLPTHLTARSIVQGELTYALKKLKTRLEQNPEALKPGIPNYQFVFGQLLEREKRVLASLDSYVKQIVHSLAVIIFKESEEMTIVQGPESVLEAMCSEISTIMERHIQQFKEKYRTARDTHSAHKFDLVVNELRCCREAILLEIKSKHEIYAKDPTSIRDSSLDIPVQSLDNTISNFGEILSLKAIMTGTSHFLNELLKMGSAVLSELELEPSSAEEHLSVEKGMSSFVHALSDALEAEALSKQCVSRTLARGIKTGGDKDDIKDQSLESAVLGIPDMSRYITSGQAELLLREAVFSAQMTFSLFKQKLLHDREMSKLKMRRPVRVRADIDSEESRDSDDTLDLQTDFQALLGPLEEVLESKHEDELEVLQVVLAMVVQIKNGGLKDLTGLEDQLKQLEQKLQHELEVAQERHNTHLEVFKQESSKLEKTLEEQQSDRDHYEERCAQLEDELNTLQLQHEEEKERVKQDILTAVHAIRSNDEKSEMHLIEKASKLGRELVMQKLNFRKFLGSLKKDVTNKEKNAIIQSIEDHMKTISLSAEEEEEDYQPPLPSQPPPDVPDGVHCLEEKLVEVTEPFKSLSSHEHAVELLKKEKEEALAEEMRNTKAALDAVRSAYEDELSKERAKYKEALLTMYTEEYINEIRLRNQEEEARLSEELKKLNMHYSSKCEDYKLMEMKLQQTKQDYESHISQLISSNNHLEELLNREIDSLKDFIKNKPSSASLTTGSATMEEELYDAKIMVRVKDTELQKLRSQVKNLENSLHRTTEEQRQTMTSYMQSLKSSSELKKQYQEEVTQLTEKLNKVLGSQGLKANIRRTPSFHQRARSPSPLGSSPSVRKESDHSSRDSHRRRHIQPKDLRRSKSSPSLPFVFDGKSTPAKQATPSSASKSRRSRSPKT
ncbi:unnamed protein product [Lymnaea stagnalis]|uniref:PH domain-containing protein n=1 Tax=Lymnaea stagnalis TaxID=6523 RepID=A0AAV2I6T4_LYMST